MNLTTLLASQRLMSMSPKVACPCGGALFSTCCEPFLSGLQHAPTAKTLMQSRYSAFVMGNSSYLLNTWHTSSRPNHLDLSQDTTKWLGLTVKQFETQETFAMVEFVARYKPTGGGPAGRLHEVSRFLFENNQWFYLDGDLKSQ